MGRMLLALLVGAGFVACSDDDDDGTTPPPPQGTATFLQVDRMGRAAINTALVNTFELTAGQTKDQAQDAYNKAADRTTWAGSFTTTLAQQQAVYDGLDTVCGNQLGAAPATGGVVPANRYQTLATVLADDAIFINTATGTCTTYLAVEANATGLAPNSDCGGRTPRYNTIDPTYSILVLGAASGVTNGIFADPDGPPSLTAFPFLNAPTPVAP